MTPRHLIIPIVSLLGIMAASCGTDDPAKEDYNDTFENYFGYSVGRNPEGEELRSTVLPVGDISVSFNDDSRRASVRVSKLGIGSPASFNYIDLNMTDLGFQTDPHGVRTIAADKVDAGGRTVEHFTLTYYPDREVNGVLYHGLTMRVMINKLNDITFFPREGVAVGATESIPVSEPGSEGYVSTTTSYVMALQPERRTAVIQVDGLSPAPGVEFPDRMLLESSNPSATSGSVPLRLILRCGGYTLSADTIVPTVEGVPEPGLEVTRLEADCDLAKDRLNLSFTLGGEYSFDAALSTCLTPQLHPVIK